MAYRSWQCSYNIDALSAIHDETTRAYPEGHIRLLEMAKQGIRSEVCWSRNASWGFRLPTPLIWILITLGPRQGVTSYPEYILEKSMRVCAHKYTHIYAYTPAHTHDRGGFAERMTHLWDISQSALISYRIHLQNFKTWAIFSSPIAIATPHVAASNVKGESTRSVKRTMRVTPPQTGGTLILRAGIPCLSIRRGACDVYTKLLQTLRAYKQDSRVNKRRLIQNF